MRVPITIEPATPQHEAFLRARLYDALFVEPGGDPFAPEIVDEPGLARYHRGFGRPGDVGRIAWVGGTPVGAAWVRQGSVDDPGYGFVDADTPELSIAVVDEWRGQGIGGRLLTSLFAEVDRCSLSVDRRNPAVRLYERLGFVVVRADGDSLFMLRG